MMRAKREGSPRERRSLARLRGRTERIFKRARPAAFIRRSCRARRRCPAARECTPIFSGHATAGVESVRPAEGARHGGGREAVREPRRAQRVVQSSKSARCKHDGAVERAGGRAGERVGGARENGTTGGLARSLVFCLLVLLGSSTC